jgi:transposase-like protein
MTVDRLRGLPPEALRRVLLHQAGLSYQQIASELSNTGIDVSWPTIRRAVKGFPPYETLAEIDCYTICPT